MAMPRSLFITLAIFLGFLSGSYAARFRISNECISTVWPAIVANSTSTTGFSLQPGKSYMVTMPTGEVKVWARTFCSYSIAGNFSCFTGDCSSSNIDCRGGNANPKPPVTLAEFTLNGSYGLDYYKVSLREGFNLPMSIEPGGSCRSTGCGRDLNQKCPTKLKVIIDGGDVVGCQSLCQAHETCKSTLFSEFSKTKCPEAYQHGSFTCASAQYYTVTFCPTSSRSSKNAEKEKKSPVENSGGQVQGSLYVLLRLVKKYVVPIVAVTVSVSLFITFACICFRCRTWYSSPKRQWGMEMVMGQTSTTAEALARNQQHVYAEMAWLHQRESLTHGFKLAMRVETLAEPETGGAELVKGAPLLVATIGWLRVERFWRANYVLGLLRRRERGTK
ncbi:hypothetical protein JHK86_015718 [Glycine max]|nr:hypothetical protein JHK86_015718 [Glycine max]